MRCARQEDCEPLLEWRNHPETRRYFLDSSVVAPAMHKEWFIATLKNPFSHLLIGEDSSERAVGVVRFDQKGSFADTSIYLRPQTRGQGLGLPLLEAAVQWLKVNTTVEVICANVLAANTASLKIFAAAGFTRSTNLFSLNICR